MSADRTDVLGDTSSGGGGASVNLEGVSALVFFALVFLYYGLSEAMTGQTLGKRLFGVRVVSADGSRPSTGAIAGRTALRIIDGLPFAYLVGLVAIVATGSRRQRIGDLAADTTVARA